MKSVQQLQQQMERGASSYPRARRVKAASLSSVVESTDATESPTTTSLSSTSEDTSCPTATSSSSSSGCSSNKIVPESSLCNVQINNSNVTKQTTTSSTTVDGTTATATNWTTPTTTNDAAQIRDATTNNYNNKPRLSSSSSFNNKTNKTKETAKPNRHAQQENPQSCCVSNRTLTTTATRFSTTSSAAAEALLATTTTTEVVSKNEQSNITQPNASPQASNSKKKNMKLHSIMNRFLFTNSSNSKSFSNRRKTAASSFRDKTKNKPKTAVSRSIKQTTTNVQLQLQPSDTFWNLVKTKQFHEIQSILDTMLVAAEANLLDEKSNNNKLAKHRLQQKYQIDYTIQWLNVMVATATTPTTKTEKKSTADDDTNNNHTKRTSQYETVHAICMFQPTVQVVQLLLQSLVYIQQQKQIQIQPNNKKECGVVDDAAAAAAVGSTSANANADPLLVQDMNGRTPLHIAAAKHCSIHVLRVLLDLPPQQEEEVVTLYESSESCSNIDEHIGASVVSSTDSSIRRRKKLQKQVSKSVRIKDRIGRYPLHWFCANINTTATMKNDAVASQQQQESSTKQQQQQQQNHYVLQVIQLLISVHQHAVTAKDIYGMTPLDYASLNHGQDTILHLLHDTTIAIATRTSSFHTVDSRVAVVVALPITEIVYGNTSSCSSTIHNHDGDDDSDDDDDDISSVGSRGVSCHYRRHVPPELLLDI